jgi:hypothetical protein
MAMFGTFLGELRPLGFDHARVGPVSARFEAFLGRFLQQQAIPLLQTQRGPATKRTTGQARDRLEDYVAFDAGQALYAPRGQFFPAFAAEKALALDQ